jgi:hypothetical protein
MMQLSTAPLSRRNIDIATIGKYHANNPLGPIVSPPNIFGEGIAEKIGKRISPRQLLLPPSQETMTKRREEREKAELEKAEQETEPVDTGDTD